MYRWNGHFLVLRCKYSSPLKGIAFPPNLKAVLTERRQGCAMVTRKRFRTVLNALALYTIAALVIGYFGVNAYSGNRGLRAKQDLDQQIAELSAELDALKAERANWERRVSLLKSESIATDILAERARVPLDSADPRELTLPLKHPCPRWTADSGNLRNRFFLPISRHKEPRP